MGKHRISNLTQKLRVAAAILMVSSLGLFYPGTVSNLRAQSPMKAMPSSPAGGPKEGIKVHGSWTIEIRNPDGKLVTRREFNNSLSVGGAATLNHFLQRTATAGEWRITLTSSGVLPCVNASNQTTACFIYETNSNINSSQNSYADASNAFKTLTISSAGNLNNDTVLKGTVTARQDGSIGTVITVLSRCPVNSPGVCADLAFTLKDMDAISVVAGQIIQVTVVISFS